jgi:hypothetical protein
LSARLQKPVGDLPPEPAATAMPPPASLRLASSARAPESIHHGLDALAGFYRSEAEALVVLHHLVDAVGLNPEHLVVLGPHQALWPRFVRRAVQWNRRPHQRDHWRAGPIGTAAVVGAMMGAAAANSGLVSADITQTVAPDLLLALLAAMIGAMAGASLVGLMHRQQPQYKTFDRLLRRKLGEGCWLVVVHDLPWAQQARVVELVSRQSLNWSAVSSAAHG